MKKIFIANWKMFLTYNEEINWFKNNLKQLRNIAENNQIIICPSYLSLSTISNLLENSKILLGAQNCASKLDGVFTGEVSTKSLKEIGIKFCISGHSERRQFFGETNETVEQKVKLLLENNLIPILCIGESKNEYENNQAKKNLEEQLFLINTLNNFEKIIIAYEPIWAIGTNIIPDFKYLTDIFKFIKQKAPKNFLLYGGSVNNKNCDEFKKISNINGFLIGRSSINFDEFKNIVLNFNELVE